MYYGRVDVVQYAIYCNKGYVECLGGFGFGFEYCVACEKPVFVFFGNYVWFSRKLDFADVDCAVGAFYQKVYLRIIVA